MQFHNLKSPRRKRKKQIGRGGKRGTYSGRGIKGQKARAGHRMRPQFRDIIAKKPKKRGYRMQTPKKHYAEVNVGELESKMQSGERISPEILVERGLVKLYKGRIPSVKLLGSGALTKNLLVKDCQISGGARKKIEEAGGRIL
ncbi:MAG: 50S ribosomal protein L15 [Patescibacteria group bacterium]